jgi:uncharacterized protein with GYD domain
MSTYVTLWKYTKDGLIDMRKTPERFEVVKKIISSINYFENMFKGKNHCPNNDRPSHR